jgi:hypothetical protein
MPDLSSKHRRDLQEVMFILEEERRRNRKATFPTLRSKKSAPVVKEKVPKKRTLLRRIAELIGLPKTEVSI